jgi:prepilin-type N-terminal cleavage/methylation domain-containing protein
MSPRRRDPGFSVFEMMVAIAVLGITMAAFGHGLNASTGLASTSRATLLANDDERRSLDAIASVLRGASFTSLTGFDETGSTTSLTFQRVLGIGSSSLVLDEPETISWRAVTRDWDGITNPGEVALTRGQMTTVIAPRVPGGGFKLTLVGNTLRIDLTTFSSTSQRKVSFSDATTYVSIRN